MKEHNYSEILIDYRDINHILEKVNNTISELTEIKSTLLSLLQIQESYITNSDEEIIDIDIESAIAKNIDKFINEYGYDRPKNKSKYKERQTKIITKLESMNVHTVRDLLYVSLKDIEKRAGKGIIMQGIRLLANEYNIVLRDEPILQIPKLEKGTMVRLRPHVARQLKLPANKVYKITEIYDNGAYVLDNGKVTSHKWPHLFSIGELII